MQGLKDVVKKTEQIQFYIKTIQFFDENGQKKNEPILVEQVFGAFDDFRLYDTAHLHYKEKIYYFKRLFNEPNTEKSPQLADNSMNSLTEGVESTLQLFSFNLKDGTEKELENFFLDEFDEADIEGLEEDKKQSNQYKSGDKQIMDLLLELKDKASIQFNVQFSQRFGSDSCENYESEDDFLSQQFLSFQQYVRSKEYHPFQIFSMKAMLNLESSDQDFREEDLEIVDTDKKRSMYNDINDVNRQVQLINHIMLDDRKITFIVQNMFAIVEIAYSVNKEDVSSIRMFSRQSSDIFQKIWNNNGGIQVQ